MRRSELTGSEAQSTLELALWGSGCDDSLVRCEEKYIILDARPIPISSSRAPVLLRGYLTSFPTSIATSSKFVRLAVQRASQRKGALGTPAAKSGPCIPFPLLRPSSHSPPGIPKRVLSKLPSLYFFKWSINIHLHVKFCRKKIKTKMTDFIGMCRAPTARGRFMSD